jgi:hypothetical protein
MLQWLGAFSVGSAYGLVSGCSDSSSGSGKSGDAGDAGTSEGGPLAEAGQGRDAGDAASVSGGALAQLRALLRTSPDHLLARAADVVSTKDPGKIAEFVRDHITVLPGIGRSDDPELATYTRWGAMPTLRAGAGSLRDRVDLMVMLLAAAGISSTVRAIETPASLTAADLYAIRDNAFSLDLGRLEAVTNMSTTAAPTNPPDASVESNASFEATLSGILNAAKASITGLPKSDLPVPTRLPVVVASSPSPSSGNVQVLVAVADQAVTTVDASTLVSATDANVPNIGITVSALMNPPAGAGSPAYVDLVSGTWPVDQVAGHQAQIVFMPRDGAAAALAGPLPTQHVRIPMIRIQPRPGVELDPYANELLPPSMRSAGAGLLDGGIRSMKNDLGAIGAPFTIDGELVSVSTAGAMDPNAPLVSLDDKARTAAVTSVAKIDATINATTFPTIELDLSISDGKGDSVDGLLASDLVVTEDGAPMPITLVRNRVAAHPPRVLIAYDGSGSITQSFGTVAARQAFDQNLATTLANVAKQPFEVQVISLAGNVDPKGWAAPAVNALTTAMDNAFSLSDVWATFVGSPVDSGPAVIIMVSDFDDPDPTYVDAAKARLARAGIPVIAVTVGTIDENAVSQIVAASSGVEISSGSSSLSSTVTSIVEKAVSQRATVGYTLRYDAPESGKSTRSVKVALATKTSISTTGSYQVPAQSARIAPPSVVAVYVTISFADVSERRRLGGAFVTDHGVSPDDLQSQAIIDDARAVLDGTTSIAIEPASPLLSQVLDDVVLAHQSLGPLQEVWSTSDITTFTNAAAKTYRYPGVFAGLLPAPPAEDGAPVIVPHGLRVAILTERPIAGKIVRQIDMPPRLNAMRALTGGSTDLEAVVRSSLLVSLNEARVFDESAYEQLAHRPLAVVMPGAALPANVQDAYAKSPADAANLTHLVTSYDDLIRLVPTDGGSVAFWVVDPASGSVAAIDATGRGGGSSGLETLLAALNFCAFCLGLPCSLDIMKYPYWCTGVTVAAIGITAAATFTGPITAGWRYGVIGTVFGASFKLKPSPTPFAPPTRGNVYRTCYLILLFLLSVTLK